MLVFRCFLMKHRFFLCFFRCLIVVIGFLFVDSRFVCLFYIGFIVLVP